MNFQLSGNIVDGIARMLQPGTLETQAGWIRAIAPRVTVEAFLVGAFLDGIPDASGTATPRSGS